MELTAENVNKVFRDCLSPFLHDESVIIEGIVHKHAFEQIKLEENRDRINALLEQLPENFKEDVGGGWSFLNACQDRAGTLWGQHPDMDRLFSLGIGIGRVKYLMPREFWNSLPGGVPYLAILSNGEKG